MIACDTACDSLNSPPCRKCEELVARKGWFSPWAGDSLLALEIGDDLCSTDINGRGWTISSAEGHDDSLNDVTRFQPATREGRTKTTKILRSEQGPA